MGALLSLLRSEYKQKGVRKIRSRSTSEQGLMNSSMRERHLDSGSNSSINNNNNSFESNDRSAREVVFPDSFEVLPQPRDLSVIYMGVPHEQQRKFRCRFCGKGYRWKSTMRRHEMVECGGKPPAFQCPECPYKARQRGNLTVHYKRHHQKAGVFEESQHETHETI
ncbi:gastrula zinc finger protein XlCGF64.1-like [Belonocnema kinseyi]|uniref:gastrula zinc finger protein XlCGF64.1-like n=1 Tax=Belonocnema kinseyi TaxID=2817044 RepID=UPI00143DB385|nr:gastrula zinc finger protein XlCGF64.1-like [Belonocnema kinseyi]